MGQRVDRLDGAQAMADDADAVPSTLVQERQPGGHVVDAVGNDFVGGAAAAGAVLKDGRTDEIVTPGIGDNDGGTLGEQPRRERFGEVDE